MMNTTDTATQYEYLIVLFIIDEWANSVSIRTAVYFGSWVVASETPS